MATYGQLLIDAGGGVIDHGKQSPRQDGATVVIGLGGTGSDAVIKLKKEVYKQLQPDDVNAVIPKYSAIKYLIIDSDASKLNAQNGKLTDIDKNLEFFPVSNNTIKATFENKRIMDNRQELFWLDYEHISIDDASAGAGGIRQVGRFLLVDRAEQLYAKLKSTMEQALTAAKSGTLNVHICAGISGGTGSGTFLDVCYLVREALREIGKPESKVCGYFFLPDVNLSVPEIRENPLIADYIKVNGYSALQELDYCMNLAKNKDKFRMNYGFRAIEKDMKPVDLCYLISTTDNTGNRVADGYRYAMGVVVDYIISFLARVELPAGVDTKDNDGLTLEGHISNLNSIKAGIKLQHGASVDYNILGASVAEMPLSAIATYLGSKLFENYRDIYDRVPLAAERDNFLVMNELQYEDILKKLRGQCRNSVGFGKAFDAKLYKTNGNGKFVNRAEEFLSENKGEIEKNAKTMMEELGDFDIDRAGTSLISITFKSLCDHYVVKLDAGPFYAKRLLYGANNENLLHAVDGYIARNSEMLAHELRQSQLRTDEYNDAEARMNSSGMLNEKSRLEAYINALNNLYVHHYKVEVYKNMENILQTYKKQLQRLDQNFFNILTTVLDTLRETFAENAKVLSEGVRDDNSYSWKILDIPDIQAGLDDVVKNMDLEHTLNDLMMALFENTKKWISQDENEISKLISDFILKEFGAATQKTMTQYLKEKYEVDNTALLVKAIRDNIIEGKLWSSSAPLFWQNSLYHNAVSEQSTLSVPYDAAEIKDAAEEFATGHGQVTVRHTGITDKLSLMRFISGLPMYSYQGILELQDAYEKDNKPGRHLYERGAINWNDMLPAPIPDSFEVTKPIERIAKKNEAARKLFETAEAEGVIRKDDMNNWDIQSTPMINLPAFVKEAAGGKDVNELDASALNKVIKAVADKKAEILSQVKPVRIEYLSSQPGNERQVMMDFYLLAPVLQRNVMIERKKRADFDAMVANLTALQKKLAEGSRGKTNFFNAIFTGVLPYGKKIVFTYDEFGMQKSVELQTNSMEYGQAGAYQAYLTYEALDPAMRKKIDAATMARMDEEDSAAVKESVAMLDATMAQRIAGYMSIYDGDLKRDEIDAFYTEFMKAFQNFKLLNM